VRRTAQGADATTSFENGAPGRNNDTTSASGSVILDDLNK
jgi:hypothetical protein